MTKAAILILLGAVLLAAALLELVESLKTGTSRMRIGKRATRQRRPGVFWFGVGADLVVASAGLGLVLWGGFLMALA